MGFGWDGWLSQTIGVLKALSVQISGGKKLKKSLVLSSGRNNDLTRVLCAVAAPEKLRQFFLTDVINFGLTVCRPRHD